MLLSYTVDCINKKSGSQNHKCNVKFSTNKTNNTGD